MKLHTYKVLEALFWVSTILCFTFEYIGPISFSVMLFIGINLFCISILSSFAKLLDIKSLIKIKKSNYIVLNGVLIMLTLASCVYIFIISKNFIVYAYIILAVCLIVRSVIAIIEFKGFYKERHPKF